MQINACVGTAHEQRIRPPAYVSQTPPSSPPFAPHQHQHHHHLILHLRLLCAPRRLRRRSEKPMRAFNKRLGTTTTTCGSLGVAQVTHRIHNAWPRMCAAAVAAAAAAKRNPGLKQIEEGMWRKTGKRTRTTACRRCVSALCALLSVGFYFEDTFLRSFRHRRR